MEIKELKSNIAEKNGWKIWSLSGSLNRTNFTEADEEGGNYLTSCEKFAVDMTELTYISSAGLRVLMRLTKNATAAGKKFVILSPSGMVKTVLEESRMDLFIPILASLDELE